MKTYFQMLIHFSLPVLFVISFMGVFSPHRVEAADCIYWTNTGSNKVGMADLNDPGNPDQDITATGDNTWGGVFARDGYIYWARDDATPRIGRAKWDGSDDDGNQLPSGTYIIRAEDLGSISTVKVVKLN